MISHLLFSDVDRLVQYDPRGGLPTPWMCRGAVVRHEVVCWGQETGQGNVINDTFVSAVNNLPETGRKNPEFVITRTANLGKGE